MASVDATPPTASTIDGTAGYDMRPNNAALLGKSPPSPQVEGGYPGVTVSVDGPMPPAPKHRQRFLLLLSACVFVVITCLLLPATTGAAAAAAVAAGTKAPDPYAAPVQTTAVPLLSITKTKPPTTPSQTQLMTGTGSTPNLGDKWNVPPILSGGVEQNVGHRYFWNNSMCGQFAATVDVHGAFFDSRPEGNQQDGQRAFLAAIETDLCADPDQSDAEYEATLHGMLTEARKHINEHVHAAFFFKMGCGGIEELTLRQKLNGDIKEGFAYTICLEYILEHERYNLEEGWAFLEISYGLLIEGAAFCRRPDVDVTIAAMTARLEDAMAYHRSNKAFDHALEDAVIDCEFAKGSPQWVEQYENAAKSMTEQITNPNKVCPAQTADGEVPTTMAGLIDTIWHATRDVTSLTAGLLNTMLATDGCVDDDGTKNAPGSERVQSLVDRLAAIGLSPFSTAAEDTQPRPINYYILPSVYHKIMSPCARTDTGTCDGIPTLPYPTFSAFTDYTHTASVLDIATKTNPAECTGEPCKAAAKAVLAYQSLLHHVTPLRWIIYQTKMGMKDVDPNVHKAFYQRSCKAVEDAIVHATAINVQLPSAIQGLRDATPQLDYTCIAPIRTLPLGKDYVNSLLGPDTLGNPNDIPRADPAVG